MPEADGSASKDFHPDVPAKSEAFFLKGIGSFGNIRRPDMVF